MYATRVSQNPCCAVVAFILSVALAESANAQGVQRRLVIHTNPPGALVKIDDNEIGITPVSTSFVYYGTRKIQLIKPGFETMTFLQPIRVPWYELPGLDFFSEHVLPGERRDVRVLTYSMQPKIIVSTEQLLGRAEALRRDGQTTTLVPSNAFSPPFPANPALLPPGRPQMVPASPVSPRPLPPPQ